MTFDWRRELPSWLLLLGMFVLALISWPAAPDRIPVHWGLNMQPDRYGGRFEGLLAIPLLALGIYALLLLIPRVDPGRANYSRFSGAYTTLRIAVTTFLAVVYGMIHLWLRGMRWNMNLVMPLLVGALFVVVGNLMGKLRPNWFAGIRTPWTLTSKVSWVRTHRMGGWVFVITGLVWMASALVHRRWIFMFDLGLLLAGIVLLVVYSYLTWREDPDKIPPAGTLPS